ncbi:Uncharacterised protein [Mycobacteroides abscessus subsp. abscessus]|nr:Uncharacterised protein [Mycobacteroides abscessus subsp. abscessus]
MYQDITRRILAHPQEAVSRNVAAELLGIHKDTIRKAIRGGELVEEPVGTHNAWEPAALITCQALAVFVFRRALEDAGVPVLDALIAQAKQAA